MSLDYVDTVAGGSVVTAALLGPLPHDEDDLVEEARSLAGLDTDYYVEWVDYSADGDRVEVRFSR